MTGVRRCIRRAARRRSDGSERVRRWLRSAGRSALAELRRFVLPNGGVTAAGYSKVLEARRGDGSTDGEIPNLKYFMLTRVVMFLTGLIIRMLPLTVQSSRLPIPGWKVGYVLSPHGSIPVLILHRISETWARIAFSSSFWF